jgi:hypothetical protein
LSDEAININFNSFGSAQYVSVSAHHEAPARKLLDSVTEEPFFGGGDWRRGTSSDAIAR